MHGFYKPAEPPKDSKPEVKIKTPPAKPSQPPKEESKDGYVVPDTQYYAALARVWCGLGGSGGE